MMMRPIIFLVSSCICAQWDSTATKNSPAKGSLQLNISSHKEVHFPPSKHMGKTGKSEVEDLVLIIHLGRCCLKMAPTSKGE